MLVKGLVSTGFRSCLTLYPIISRTSTAPTYLQYGSFPNELEVYTKRDSIQGFLEVQMRQIVIFRFDNCLYARQVDNVRLLLRMLYEMLREVALTDTLVGLRGLSMRRWNADRTLSASLFSITARHMFRIFGFQTLPATPNEEHTKKTVLKR